MRDIYLDFCFAWHFSMPLSMRGVNTGNLLINIFFKYNKDFKKQNSTISIIFRKLGGWSTFPVFSSQELALGVNFLELMSREFDPIPYEGLVDLVGDSAYSNLFLDTHDRGLLGYILDTCINEKAVTTNRYRSDYYIIYYNLS